MNDESREALIEQACEVMHDAYEAAALAEGWETQARSNKPWSDVPEANKATMRAAVRALLASPAMNAVVAERVAAALDEAADLLAPSSGIGMSTQPTRAEVSEWLHHRAAALRALAAALTERSQTDE